MASKQIVYLPGLVQIRPQYDANPDTGERPENVTYWLQRAPVSLTQANLTTIANAFDPLWSSIWKQGGATGKHYTGSIVSDFSSAFGLSWNTVGTLTPVAGTATGVAPAQASMLISLSTAERYRGGHFRIYLPWQGGNTLTSDPSMWQVSFVNATRTQYGNLEPGMNAIAVGGGLTQRCYRHRYDATNARLDPVQTYNVQQLIATQRRRLRKVPHH